MSFRGSTPGAILVIDSDVGVANMLATALRQHGHQAVVAADANAVARLTDERSFDLATLDQLVADRDDVPGLEWLQERLAGAPVLVASAVDRLDSAISAMRGGAAGYLLKPYDEELVLQDVDSALVRHRARQDNSRHQQRLEELVARRGAELRSVQQELTAHIRELAGRDRMVQLQMAPPAEQGDVHRSVVQIAADVTLASQVQLWLPDSTGGRLACVARACQGSDAGAGPAPADSTVIELAESEGVAGNGATTGPRAGSGRTVARAYLDAEAVRGPGGEAAVPVRYRSDTLGVLHAQGLAPDGAAEVLWRLGREAALLLRMAQVAHDIEDGQAAIDTILRERVQEQKAYSV